jgi:hypothetical protein
VTIRTADPLPECSLCGQPTKRTTHERYGGLCSACSRGIADTVRMVPVRGVIDLDRERARRRASEALTRDDDDLTAYVERYVPPVPGQLTIADLPGPRDENGDL